MEKKKFKDTMKYMTNLQITIYDWCINNNKEDILNRWDYKFNDVNPKKVGVNSSKKYWFKCLDNKNHESELHSIAGLSNGRTAIKCRQCNSFGQWCLDNNRKDILDRWDYDLNDYNPFQVSKSSAKKCYFKCPKGTHGSELKTLYSLTNNKVEDFLCKACNSFAQWGIDKFGDNFLEKYWDNNKNTINPFEIPYAYNGKVWIKCQNHDYHDSYQISCGKFSIENKRCPYCAKTSGKIHKLDSFGYMYPEALSIWSETNTKSPYEYSPHSGLGVWWKCENGIHKDYKRIIGNTIKSEFMCPNCVIENNSSKLQNKVDTYLKEKYNFEVLHERDCTINPINPKTNQMLLYDNEIKELKLVIEVMGEQHYLPTQFNKLIAKRKNITPEEALKELQWRDDFKKQHALNCGYNYLDIPYTYEKNNEYKNIIDKTISEIVNNQ